MMMVKAAFVTAIFESAIVIRHRAVVVARMPLRSAKHYRKKPSTFVVWTDVEGLSKRQTKTILISERLALAAHE